MRALQILFIVSFALLALVVPYVVFSYLQGQTDNAWLFVPIAVIFVVNAFFIVRKIGKMRENEGK